MAALPTFVAIPLAEPDTPVSEALASARTHDAEAIVVHHDLGFSLIRTEDLEGPAISATTMVGAIAASEPLEMLGAGEAHDLRFGVTASVLPDYDALFPTPAAGPLLVSLFSLAGMPMALALANPKGAFNLVTKTWTCPNDGEVFWSSGICPTHGKPLIQKP